MSYSLSLIQAKDLMDSRAVPLKAGRVDHKMALQFLSGHYKGWPVVDSINKILGVVTDLHPLQIAARRPESLDNLRIEDLMSPPRYVCESDPLDVVLNEMVQTQVLKMPVVDGDRLVGVISWKHILRLGPFNSPVPLEIFPFCAWCDRGSDYSETSTVGDRELTFFSNKKRDRAYFTCPSCYRKLDTHEKTYRSLLWSEDSEKNEGENPANLLVVDDDPEARRILNEALQDWGYKVFLARNGWEGLTVVDRHSVDGMLLDLYMPVMDGRTMLEELRWLGHQMPVVIMSNESEKEMLHQLLRNGAQGFFLKPFHLPFLKEVCQKVFAKDVVESHIA